MARTQLGHHMPRLESRVHPSPGSCSRTAREAAGNGSSGPATHAGPTPAAEGIWGAKWQVGGFIPFPSFSLFQINKYFKMLK